VGAREGGKEGRDGAFRFSSEYLISLPPSLPPSPGNQKASKSAPSPILPSMTAPPKTKPGSVLARRRPGQRLL